MSFKQKTLTRFNRSKTAVAVSIICSALTLTGCGSDNNSIPLVVQPDAPPSEPASIFESVEGQWDKTGYGQFISIADDNIQVYEYNEFGCINSDSLSYAQGEELVEQLAKTDAGLMALQLKGHAQHEYLNPADNLPESCENPLTAGDTDDPVANFDYMWHSFNDYYGFFAERGLDWQQVRDTYRPQVNEQTTNGELFAIFSDMVKPLMDAHVGISSPQDDFSVGKPVPFIRSIYGAADSTYRGGEPVAVEQMAVFFHQMVLQMQINYIDSNPQQYPLDSDFPTLVWGKTASNVGILVVNSMFEFVDFSQASDINEQQLVAAVHEKMAVVMADLAGTDGLILDVRNNEGGTDAVALAIASYFADQDSLVFNKQAVNKAGNGVQYSASLTANSDAYTQPVYLLTSQRTTSAAEIFTMAMNTLEHVTLVGEPTSGALSDVLDFTLPNGWSISLSNEVYLDQQGQGYEVSGFVPDISAPSHSTESLQSFKIDSYEVALEQLGKAQSQPLAVADFEAQVEQLMNEGLIPGAAIAVVKAGQIVYQNGFGRSDDAGTPVTPTTQFFLASVSKTLLGTTLAQVEADGVFNINDEVAPALGYAIDYPNNADFAPTFAQLVTHTSGIIDEDISFACSYYLVDGQDSLFDLFSDEPLCEDDMDIDMGNFLQHYLTDGGDKYQAGNFSSSFGVPVGQISHYSNIATGLAGQAIANKTQQPLTELTQQYVLGPLQMNNTLWSIAGIPVEVASRYIIDDGQLVTLPVYNAITYPDGGAISSAFDLAKYMSAVMNGGVYNGEQVLNADAVAKMLTNQTERPVPERGIGYFWRLDGDYFSHNGGDPGVMTEIWADTKKDVAVVLLTNGDSFDDDANTSFNTILQLAKRFAHNQ